MKTENDRVPQAIEDAVVSLNEMYAKTGVEVWCTCRCWVHLLLMYEDKAYGITFCDESKKYELDDEKIGVDTR
jgi:hypothetical protein